MNFRDFLTPAVIAANWSEVSANQIPYLGRALFPAQKKVGLDLAWLKGSKGLPISLMPSAFDAKATFRDRIGFEKLETEMPFFREGYKLKERDRQEFLRVQDTNDPYAQVMLSRIFEDVAELIAAAHVVPERMIMQLLFPVDGNVGISIKANGQDYTYNYDPDGSWKANNYIALTGDDLWSSPATSDPLKVFKTAKDTIRSNTGTELVTAIMNTATFNMLAQSEAIKDRFLTTTGRSFSYLTDIETKSIINGTTGLNIALYDKMYRDEDKGTRAFVPDGYVCLIPAGSLGTTWYGTTPEEADLHGASNADVAIVDTGVAITRQLEEHPVNINTFASEIVLPSFERMDEIAVLKVV